jgi:cell division septation protein DedD
VGGEKLKNGLSNLGESGFFNKQNAAEEIERKSEEEFPLVDIFEKDMEAETRYLEIEPEKNAEEAPQVKPAPVQVPEYEFEESPAEEEQVSVPPVRKTQETRPSPPAGDYYIQVASFVKRQNAEALADHLRKKLYKVIIEEATVRGTRFYRVRVGPFETKGIARNTMVAMKNRYDIKDPFVLKKNS